MSLRIQILVIGKVKKSYLAEGIGDYLGRLSHFVKIELRELKAPAKSNKSSPAIILRQEAERFLKELESHDYVIALDRTGKMMDSLALANFLQECMNTNRKWISILIGGELGLDRSLLQRADRVLSLSKMTLPHDMTRLILLEQLYRAFTILAGQKYHK